MRVDERALLEALVVAARAAGADAARSVMRTGPIGSGGILFVDGAAPWAGAGGGTVEGVKRVSVEAERAGVGVVGRGRLGGVGAAGSVGGASCHHLAIRGDQ